MNDCSESTSRVAVTAFSVTVSYSRSCDRQSLPPVVIDYYEVSILSTSNPSTCLTMTEPTAEPGFVQWRATFGKREYADLEGLRLIETTFNRLWLNRSKDLVPAARAIADGSKDGELTYKRSNDLHVLHTDGMAESWRPPLGESGILDVAMNIIASPGIDDDLAKQSLRIIGNTCIDTGWML